MASLLVTLRRRLSLSLLLAASAWGTASCGGPPGPSRGPTGATCPSGSTLSYANFGQAFFQSYCLRCHSSALVGTARAGAPSDHNFDTVELIREMLEHIDEMAAAGPDATNTSMPPNAPEPSLEERQKLGEWLACQAP